MKAVGLTRYLPITDPESLLDIELPKPLPGPRDLLVRVQAVAVNPVDYKVRAPKPGVENPPRVLGWDAAGIVEAVGEQVTLFRPGDAVYYAGDITRSGSNAEWHCVDERIVGRKPRSLSFREAAALPLTAITAWEGLFDRLRLDRDGGDRGRSVLIVGAAGGVGSIAIQIAKQVAGLTVIATASRPDSAAWCRALGADAVIDHTGDLPAQARALGHATVDAVLCCNDIDRHFPALATLIRPQGLICSILSNEQPLSFEPLKSKSAGFIIEFMFTRAMYGTPDLIEQHHLLNRVADLVDAGHLRTTLRRVVGPLNATNLRAAHAELEAGRTIGKLVLDGYGVAA